MECCASRATDTSGKRRQAGSWLQSTLGRRRQQTIAHRDLEGQAGRQPPTHLCGLALGVVEVCGHGDDCLAQLLAQVGLHGDGKQKREDGCGCECEVGREQGREWEEVNAGRACRLGRVERLASRRRQAAADACSCCQPQALTSAVSLILESTMLLISSAANCLRSPLNSTAWQGGRPGGQAAGQGS
jgi:hypothetical protein